MNFKHAMAAAVLSVAFTGVSFADDNDDDDVKLEDVPKAVRETIERETKGGTIDEIERDKKQGKVVYEVEYEKGDKDYELHVGEDGKVIKNRED